MLRWGVREEDIEEEFIKGSGSGGQKINKTSMTVLLIHRPSGFQVRCQESRSQAMNRFLARRILVDKIETAALGKQSDAQQKIEKLRRQKRKRSKRAKAKMLDNKKHQGAKKALRQKGRFDF